MSSSDDKSPIARKKNRRLLRDEIKRVDDFEDRICAVKELFRLEIYLYFYRLLLQSFKVQQVVQKVVLRTQF